MALIIKVQSEISSSWIRCCHFPVNASSIRLKVTSSPKAFCYQTSRTLSSASFLLLHCANVGLEKSSKDPRVRISYESNAKNSLVIGPSMVVSVSEMLTNFAIATQFATPALHQQNLSIKSLTNANTIQKITNRRILLREPKMTELGIHFRHIKHTMQISPPLSRVFSTFSRFLPSSIIDNYRLFTSPKTISAAFASVIVRHMTSSAKKIDPIEEKRPFEDEQAKLLENKKCNKQIKINACGKLYDELVKTRSILYGGAPRGSGIDFNVQYYDSLDLIDGIEGSKLNSKTPTTVCLLHGSPGHYKFYASLINYLTIRGIRVIAPNFPDYSATFDHSFRHSPKERVEFLLEFFKSIHVTKIDMLIGHSGAVYTMLELMDHIAGLNAKQQLMPPIQIESIGFFNTPMYNLPPNLAITPFRLFTLKLFDYSFLRPIITAMIQVFVKVQGIKNRVDKNKMEDFLIAASVVGYSDLERMRKQMKAIVRKQVPTFILIGTNDRLISMDYFNQLKNEFGITNQRQVKLYDSDGGVLSEAMEPHEFVDVSQFEGGGHFAFQMYANQVNEDVHRFLIRRVHHQILESTKL